MESLTDNKNISILYPDQNPEHYHTLSELTMHDLGLDVIVKKLTGDPKEQGIFLNILSKMTAEPEVTRFRIEVFEDLRRNVSMREQLMKLLDHIDFLREYGTFKRSSEEAAGAWDLLHRLSEIRDYIDTVEAIHACLAGADIRSEGLTRLKNYIEDLYEDNGFAALKKDIAELRVTTSNLKSVTLGINLNDRFEAQQIGVVSINSKAFVKAPLISNLYDFLSKKDEVNPTEEWKGNYHFQQIYDEDGDGFQAVGKLAAAHMMVANPLLAMGGMAGVPNADEVQSSTRYLDRIANKMLSMSVHRLREILSRHATVKIITITSLIPEFLFYIRWAEFLDSLEKRGFRFATPEVLPDGSKSMTARAIYNLKLAFTETEEAGNIVPNDLDFSKEHRVYILTGANRGGKTTITQAVGILYVLAQCGVRIPGESFRFDPVDCIFTHYPADEDKTMDLGRLGEECARFREIFKCATGKSLLLLNETFSTTSFEEGYYIACDAIRAILQRDIRTIYNTHMHKIAYNLDELNLGAPTGKAASLVVESEEGKRSYRVKVAPPAGRSYAHDIALKYGVTYEELVKES